VATFHAAPHETDFQSFWAGAKLVGRDLYDDSRALALQHQVSPLVESKRYIRPPFYAVMLWPLGQLPFHVARVIWFLVNIAAMLVFGWGWRLPPSGYVVCALFVPLIWSFGLGQDAALMLAIVGAGARLVQEKQSVAGGALLSLCAIKPHLLMFVPIALLVRKEYRALAAMAGGGLVLYLVSSAVLGPAWPVDFARAAMHNESALHFLRLLGVSGILVQLHAPAWSLVACAAVGGVLVYCCGRNAAWMPTIAIAVAAGVVFAPRSLLYDGALFLPALLLRLPPLAAVLTGVALLTAATPFPIIAEVVTLAILWVTRPLPAAGPPSPSPPHSSPRG